MVTATFPIWQSPSDGAFAEWIYDDVTLVASALHVVTGTATVTAWCVYNGKLLSQTLPPGSDVQQPLTGKVANITHPISSLTGLAGFEVNGVSEYGFAVS